RQRLIVQATLQAAQQDAKRARVNLPLGVVLFMIGVALCVALMMLPVGLVGTVVIGGIGMVLIPAGVAVIVKAAAAIARANRLDREYQLPAARTIK
ncbi:MAG TPA: hypothetical protein VIV40_18185, partial [Kofleriaceae bacterium]